MEAPILYIVIPCYNEETVLPVTCTLFSEKIRQFTASGKVSEKSRVLFVDDGSRDGTWQVIRDLCDREPIFAGLKLSRNCGHQNALLAGLMTAKAYADVTISIDCDGQDDVAAMDQMLAEYQAGAEIVYGVRDSRKTDSFFKRNTAKGFYKLMHLLGAETVYNHADYRLMSRRALEALSEFREVNLFLRGLAPLVGFQSATVYYDRKARVAGKSHYSLLKMMALAFNGMTSLSERPLKMITILGFLISLFSFLAVIVTIIIKLVGYTVQGWTSLLCAIFLLGGIQIFCLGVIGEYIGKMYAETKARPRYIIEETTLPKPEHPDEKAPQK